MTLDFIYEKIVLNLSYLFVSHMQKARRVHIVVQCPISDQNIHGRKA